MMFAIALLASTSAAVFWSGNADAATSDAYEARCTIKVDNRIRLKHRKCEVLFWGTLSGPITCGEANGVKACVSCDKNARCEASWESRGKAERPLGRVKPVGKTTLRHPAGQPHVDC
jgi:hypothetical protein